MPKPANPRRTLLPQSLQAPKAALYVFRDDGTGRPNGAHLKKYTEPVSEEQLQKDLAPGMYILAEKSETGFKRRRIIIEGQEAPPPAAASAADPGDPIARMERLLQMQTLARALQPETNAIELVGKLMSAIRGGGEIGVFQDGLKLGRELAPADDAGGDPGEMSDEASIVREVMNSLSGNRGDSMSAREMKLLAAKILHEQKALAAMMIQTRRALAQLSKRVYGPEGPAQPGETEEPPMPPMSQDLAAATLVQLLNSFKDSMPESADEIIAHCEYVNAKTAGNLRIALRTYPAKKIVYFIDRLLEEFERGDLKPLILRTLAAFAGGQISIFEEKPAAEENAE